MGTRGSALALAQARQIAHELEKRGENLRIEERVIRTTGDKNQGAPLPEIGGKGVFTLEIEKALLAREIDFAVHSLKDLPPAMPEGLCLAAVPERESAIDVCIARGNAHIFNAPLPFLRFGARIGTSSLRRKAFLLHARPDLQIEDVRGNIDTRLKKLESEGFDAIVLAQAGLNRLGWNGPNPLFPLDASLCIPAPGQGALAIQARTSDIETRAVLMLLEDGPTRAAIEAERAVVRELEAGCSTPLGALAQSFGDHLSLHAAVVSSDGKQRVAVNLEGSGEPELIGRRAAISLLQKGAGMLLSE